MHLKINYPYLLRLMAAYIDRILIEFLGVLHVAMMTNAAAADVAIANYVAQLHRCRRGRRRRICKSFCPLIYADCEKGRQDLRVRMPRMRRTGTYERKNTLSPRQRSVHHDR